MKAISRANLRTVVEELTTLGYVLTENQELRGKSAPPGSRAPTLAKVPEDSEEPDEQEPSLVDSPEEEVLQNNLPDKTVENEEEVAEQMRSSHRSRN